MHMWIIYVGVSSVNAYATSMDRDEDLGALFATITRRLIGAERPLLQAAQLSMWQYIVLCELARAAAPSQLVLARRIGYDKTRLIAVIDELSERGLIRRTPDPADRRARCIALTDRGAELLAATRTRIRAMECDLLGSFTEREQAILREILAHLATSTEQFARG
jgi:DNA-binding MarR family transcriptional regulator